MAYLLITEFEIAKTHKITKEMCKAHKAGVMDIVRMTDGMILLTAPDEWRPIDDYQE